MEKVQQAASYLNKAATDARTHIKCVQYAQGTSGVCGGDFIVFDFLSLFQCSRCRALLAGAGDLQAASQLLMNLGKLERVPDDASSSSSTT
jgi:hypothetical protein